MYQPRRDYVAYELFRAYNLTHNKWTTEDRIKRLWGTAKKDHWLQMADTANTAINKWNELNYDTLSATNPPR